jgi:hypothetical protein
VKGSGSADPRPDRAVLIRVAVALAGAAVIVLGVTHLHDDERCHAASGRAFAVFVGARRDSLPRDVREIERRCAGAGQLAASVSALKRAGLEDDALLAARESIRRAPDDYATWLALSIALESRDPAGAARALARAHALNPRYVPASARPAPGGGP